MKTKCLHARVCELADQDEQCPCGHRMLAQDCTSLRANRPTVQAIVRWCCRHGIHLLRKRVYVIGSGYRRICRFCGTQNVELRRSERRDK